MSGVAFVSLDGSPEPEWQVRVDRIDGIGTGADGLAVVLTSSGRVIVSELTVPELMAKMQRALASVEAAGDE